MSGWTASTYLARPHDLLGCVDRLSAAGTFLRAPELLCKFRRVGVGSAFMSLRPERETHNMARY